MPFSSALVWLGARSGDVCSESSLDFCFLSCREVAAGCVGVLWVSIKSIAGSTLIQGRNMSVVVAIAASVMSLCPEPDPRSTSLHCCCHCCCSRCYSVLDVA